MNHSHARNIVQRAEVKLMALATYNPAREGSTVGDSGPTCPQEDKITPPKKGTSTFNFLSAGASCRSSEGHRGSGDGLPPCRDCSTEDAGNRPGWCGQQQRWAKTPEATMLREKKLQAILIGESHKLLTFRNLQRAAVRSRLLQMLGQETADGRGVTGHNVLRGVGNWNRYVDVFGYLLFPNVAQQVSNKSTQHFLPLSSVVDLDVDEIFSSLSDFFVQAKDHALMGIPHALLFLFTGLLQLVFDGCGGFGWILGHSER
ncbi:hypothetical protein OUZ56_032903 [Daphnia magna]|uniref:Uncharacterized protein n=1 Tax=Daphnia magna TaxID=35525 RepID=A0ABR0B9W1_9CRUS|nr:hypothetical protein OUZ56_032903 [Daphnia magna]